MTDHVSVLPVRVKISVKHIISISAGAVFFSILSLILWSQPAAEAGIVIFHNLIYSHPALLSAMKWITRYGLNLMEFSYGLMIFLTFRPESHRFNQPVFLAVLLTVLLNDYAGDWLKEMINRSRPAVELAGQIANTYVSNSPSFPSGHATKAMGLALPFLLLSPQRDRLTRYFSYWILFLAVMVCYSRLALQYHYLSDITGGVAFILIFLLFTACLANLILLITRTGETRMKKVSVVMGLIFITLSVYYCFS